MRNAVEAENNVRIPICGKVEGKEAVFVVNEQGNGTLHIVSVQQRPHGLVTLELISSFVCFMNPFLGMDAIGFTAAAVIMSLCAYAKKR